MPEWIYCKERLPENDDDVLVTLKDREWTYVSIDHYNADPYNPGSGEWYNADQLNEVCIAWMPLPKPAEVR